MPRPGTPRPPRLWGTGLDQGILLLSLSEYQAENGLAPRKHQEKDVANQTCQACALLATIPQEGRDVEIILADCRHR